MRTNKPAAACGFFVLIALAACGGGSSNPSPSPVPCPLAAGADAIPAPPQLLYPAPSATGVPDGNFTLVVGYGTASPPPLQLVPAGLGGYVAGGAWGPAPSPLPSPAATPRSSNEALFGSAIPLLSAKTTYDVDVTFGTPPCQTTESAGLFTTR